jgi:hypothetical protein
MEELICASCLTIGRTRKITRGSFFIELILWCCLIIPGIIYSAWRLTTRRMACSVCKGTNLIPLSSPMGQRLTTGRFAGMGGLKERHE